VAKGGDRLLREDAVSALVSRLLPLALVSTPNAGEAGVLCGHPVETMEQAREAARAIHGMGCRYVVVKGGHFGEDAVDVLYDGSTFTEFPARRIATTSTHGTGCTFASAVAAGLARGGTVEDAVAGAKSYVTAAISNAPPIGRGHGPLHHFHAWWSR
jgi:hydroxymethylpyrimidine/phosphomethylpyrimidine kinase